MRIVHELTTAMVVTSAATHAAPADHALVDLSFRTPEADRDVFNEAFELVGPYAALKETLQVALLMLEGMRE